MPRTDYERQLNRQIYEDIHVKQGNTLEAAIMAGEYLATIDTQDFQNFERAEAHGEFAHQAVHLGITAVRRSPEFHRAVFATQQTADLLLEHYPVSTSRTEAIQRNEYWEPVFDTVVNAQVRCLRDFVNLLDVIEKLEPSATKVPLFREALLHALSQFSGDISKESGYLLLLIERADYPFARKAFFQLIQQQGTYLFEHNKPELTAAAWKLYERALEAKDRLTILTLGGIFSVLRKVSSQFREATKVSMLTHKQELALRGREWAAQRIDSLTHLDLETLEKLTAISFIGLGEKVGILEIPSLERE